jgi:hypothetical protein
MDICDDNGNNFDNNTLREKYIYDHFADIYGTEMPHVTVDDINRFLGPEIINSEILANKKLPENLKQDFEAPLSKLELDHAINSAKPNTAGGSDGLNNKVLKKFWNVFREPLYEYAKHILVTGKLTQSFNGASIKLIPKKGDLKKIGNWRPISLLNCVYKVISRAANNRLQKAAPFLLTRAQKGFVKNRYIQECLINVLEKIAYCNNHHVPALVIAIDQSKAFDKVSHSFLTAVYEFFNFGRNFIKLLDSIGNGRNACILWEDGSRSKSFDLKTGRAQGDGPSPLQYNFSEQILLLKIELDPEIKSAFNTAVVASRIPEPLPWFECEINKKTDKVEALADDTTVVIKCCESSLLTLHKSLTDFADISGLVCNFDKTCIIPIGGLEMELPFDIQSTNFKITNRVKLLGLDIDMKLDCLVSVHEKTYEKIANILAFWSRFWLSLPGRINIVKTLCLSQLSYVGCIISPTSEQLRKIEDVITKFVKGKLNISKDRLYAKPSEGGLGLIDLRSFLCAQQVQWIKRIFFAACDTWREEVFNLTYGNPLVLDPSLVNKSCNPIIYNIATSFQIFKKNYFLMNDNYKKAPIFLNPIFVRGRGDKRLLDNNFFSQQPPLNNQVLAGLLFKDVFDNAPLLLETINQGGGGEI